MAEEQAVTGVKITRPGAPYYFDDGTPKCPTCGSQDVEYGCRVRSPARTAQFKCSTCQCKFEKTRTVETEPVGYTPRPSVDAVFALACRECNSPLDMKLGDFEKAERVACRACGTILKNRTGATT